MAKAFNVRLICLGNVLSQSVWRVHLKRDFVDVVV